MILWGSYDGRVNALATLGDDHLINIRKWISDYPEVYSPEIRDAVDEEIDRRGIDHLTNLAPLPFVNDDGDWVSFEGSPYRGREIVLMPVERRRI